MALCRACSTSPPFSLLSLVQIASIIKKERFHPCTQFNRYAQDDNTDVTTIDLCQTAGDGCPDKSQAYVFCHEDYNTDTSENDVALIILPKGKQVTLIPLVALNRDPKVTVDGQELEVFRLGDISNEPTVIEPNYIMTRKQTYVNNTACQERLVSQNKGGVITNDMLCGVSATSKVASGDSGT